MRLRWKDILSTSLICASIGVTANAPLRAQSASCQQIRAACKNAGFVQGGPIGERLVLDCFNPIVLGQMPKRPASKPLPQIDPQLAAACKDSLSKRSSGANARAQPSIADTSTLTASDDGRTVHDSRLAVTWLADGNLAATQSFGVPNINGSGSMSYAAAIQWVAAMNASNNGAGYLGHNNWQLPTAPGTDKTCQLTGPHGEPFGYNCSGSALGSLYYVSFGLQEPNSAVANSQIQAGPFKNFQAYLYWSKSPAIDPKHGFVSFSFSSGFQGANVFRNYLYVLPMFKGKLPGMPSTADNYLQVDANGTTVYDPIAQVTWLADANLAASQTFGVAGINRDGSMEQQTAITWVGAMNSAGWLGATDWQLPTSDTCGGFDCKASLLGDLYYNALGYSQGQPVVATPNTKTGDFHDLQPYLYWSCSTTSVPCSGSQPAGSAWSFSFGNGFEGTDLIQNDLYVMVYYPTPPSPAPAKPVPPHCHASTCK